MYWGWSKDDAEGDISTSDDAYQRLRGIDADILDFRVAEFDARIAQEAMIVADDLIGWTDSGAEDDDALAELFSTCDGVHAGALLLDTSPPQAAHVRGVATVCAE